VSTDFLVTVTEQLHDAALAWLRDRCRVEQIGVDSPEFADMLQFADGIIVRTYTIVDSSLLDRAPRIKVVGRAGVGLDNIDLDECRRRSIKVVYTPDANTQAVVEYVFRLVLDELRPVHRLTESISDAEWRRLRSITVGRRQLSELTLGIMGLGRIGKRVAEVGRSFGMNVIYHDIEAIPTDSRHGAEPVNKDELFERADVLSIHIDGRPENRCAVNERSIRLMKQDVIFVNTSRGFVVDHDALAMFLADCPAATALLDVHEPEPIAESNPMLPLPNAKLYPHIASRSMKAMENMSWVVKDVWAVLEGRDPQWSA
jgi:phosphoglycerate dehydrogenase-like enzyme